MAPNHRDLLKDVRAFPQLIKYLHDELDWPISSDNFEDLTFDYTPEELGIDRKNAAKIKEIRRLRPLVPNQPPWAIFFVKFEPKRLPVVALRRILSRVVFRKRASANVSERPAWSMNDLLFISNYGESEERRISLAHFSQNVNKKSLPTLTTQCGLTRQSRTASEVCRRKSGNSTSVATRSARSGSKIVAQKKATQDVF